MPWELDNDRPIYLQLMERIQQDIVSGIYKPGDRLPLCPGSRRRSCRESEHNAKSTLRTGTERTGIFSANKRTFYYRRYPAAG